MRSLKVFRFFRLCVEKRNATFRVERFFIIRKVITMKDIINALSNALKAVKNIPAAPIFDANGIITEFKKMGMPEKFINSAVAELKTKHEEIHGDNEEKFSRIIIAEIAPALGGIDNLAIICRKMNNEEIEKKSIKFTKGELEDINNSKAQSFIKQIQALYKAGKQTSEIQKELNFYSYPVLHSFIKENETLFPSRK